MDWSCDKLGIEYTQYMQKERANQENEIEALKKRISELNVAIRSVLILQAVVKVLSSCCQVVVKLLSSCCQAVVKLLSSCCQGVVIPFLCV